MKTVYTDIISVWAAQYAKFSQYKLFELKKYILSNNKEEMEKILNQALQSMSFTDKH